MVRWTARNMAYNLTFIPADRLDWNPAEGVKSALAIAAEVVGVMRNAMPLFAGGEFEPAEFPRLPSGEDARRQIVEAADRYAEALEAAGPALERPVNVGGMSMWAKWVALFPAVELLHHHGQIAYLQMLLGDMETHFDMEASARYFGAPAGGA